MISIVICSIQPQLAKQVSANIAKTIGVPHEILIIDNQKTGHGLAHVYNQGGGTAKFQIVCFLHEDVLFSEKGWGKVLVHHFEQYPNTGAIGLAGASYKAATPSGWYTGLKGLDFANITHRNYLGQDEHIYLTPFPGKHVQEVITLDGVFICTLKSNLYQVKWDEENLKHFHFYDLDFSLRLFLAGKKNFVTFDIDLVHLTEGGSFSNEWVTEAMNWHKRFADHLPLAVDGGFNLRHSTIKTEHHIAKTWLLFLRRWPILKKNKWKWLWASRILIKPDLWLAALSFWFSLKLKRGS